MIASRFLRWLAATTDPDGYDPARHGLLPALTADELRRVAASAEAHGLLPVFARTITAMANEPGAPEALAVLQGEIAPRVVAVTSYNMLLASHGRRLEAALKQAGIPAVLVKGVDLSERAYGGHGRTYSDVDLLVPPRDLERASALVVEAGYAAVPAAGKRIDYTERQFLGAPPTKVLVELLTNLVHAPELRARVSLDRDAYLDGADAAGLASPEALLELAVVHGAASHLFDRLQQVTDVAMVARGHAGGIDIATLSARLERSGARLFALVGLSLAAGVYGCRASEGLLRTLKPTLGERAASAMISPRGVMQATSDSRWQHSWRRRLFRGAFARGLI